MAVTAIQAVVANVMFMTELDGLLPFDPLTGVPRRAIQLRGHPERRHENKHRAVDRQFGKGVSAVMKNLRHRRSFGNLSLQQLKTAPWPEFTRSRRGHKTRSA